MTTWAEIINLTLNDSGVLGVGQTPQPADTNNSLKRLNMMLNQWKRRRWLVYHLLDLSTPMDGSEFYTIGVGATINYPRPDQIDAAFVRQVSQSQPNQPDYPLRIIKSYEEYSRIALKRLSAGPSRALFYDSGYPEGKIYPYPLASSQYELHVIVKAELDNANSLTDTIILPPEYEQAIYANLMRITRMAYRLPADKEVNTLAAATLETLRTANYQVPSLIMPAAVQGTGAYNIFTDTWGPSYR